MSKKFKIAKALRFGLIILLLWAAPCFAHKVNLFAYVEGETVYVESYFPDGRAVTNGKIEVFDEGKILLLEGHTDSEGLFHFPIPKYDNLTIVLDASMGHKTTYEINRQELGK
jgi:nickel transport protein